jgi:pimeloyl-ACP methyl ester carboxylesterase
MLLIRVDDAIARLSTEQRHFAHRFIASMLPVSLRLAGVTFDNGGGVPGDRIVGITAPSLIVHAQDDALQLYDHATFAVMHIPGSALLSYEQGGHLVLITKQEEVSRAVLTHVRDHAR